MGVFFQLDDVDAFTQLLVWGQDHTAYPAYGVFTTPEPVVRRPASFFPEPPGGGVEFRRCSDYIFGRRPRMRSTDNTRSRSPDE